MFSPVGFQGRLIVSDNQKLQENSCFSISLKAKQVGNHQSGILIKFKPLITHWKTMCPLTL